MAAALDNCDVSSTTNLILYNIWALLNSASIKGTMTPAELDLSSTTNWILYNIYLSLAGGSLNPTLQQVLTNGNTTTLQAIFQDAGIETIVDGQGVSVDDGAGTAAQLGNDKLEMQNATGQDSALSASGVLFNDTSVSPNESAVLDAQGLGITDSTDESLITKSIITVRDAVKNNVIDKESIDIYNATIQIFMETASGRLVVEDLVNLTKFQSNADGSIDQTNLFNSVLTKDTIFNAEINLSAAQIKTLQSAPVTIVPAIAGKAIQVMDAGFDFVFGTVAFTNTTPSLITNPNVAQASATNLFNSVASRKGTFSLVGFAGALSNLATNSPLIIRTAADSAVGDGTCKVNVKFRYIDSF